MLELQLPRHWRSMKEDIPGGIRATMVTTAIRVQLSWHAEDKQKHRDGQGRAAVRCVNWPRASGARALVATPVAHEDRPSTRVWVRMRGRVMEPKDSDRTNGWEIFCAKDKVSWRPGSHSREKTGVLKLYLLFKCQHVNRRSTQKCLSTVFQY